MRGKVVKRSKSASLFPKWPMYSERELQLVQEVIKSQEWWRITGSKVKEFEKSFAAFHHIKHCLGVTNGTHAIEMALSALDVEKGDEVIVPAFTFISTATAPIYCNAIPVLVDIDPDTFCIDPKAVEAAVGSRTKAIIPVHMAGHVCDMDKIGRTARKHQLFIIEDAAHAHGAEWKGRKVGSFSDIATFSFQNGKIMTCGEGGALVTNDDDLYQKLFLIHAVGRPEKDSRYQHLVLGSNYRMNELQAAVLIAQLERLERLNLLREKNAQILDALLSEIDGIQPQKRKKENNVNTHYMYMFYYNSKNFHGISRDEFVAKLKKKGIPAFIAYPVINNTHFFKEKLFRKKIGQEKIKKNNLSNALRIEKEVVWFPHYVLLGDKSELLKVVGAIKEIRDRKI